MKENIMPVESVDAKTLRMWLGNDEAVLIDVRQPAEHNAQHISKAVSIPSSSIGKSNLPDCGGRKIVIQCQRGFRSKSACSQLQREMPDTTLYNLAGGISAWVKAGYPVEGSGRTVMPLDRQVQLTIGLCVLGGSLLAYFVNPQFLFLTGFFGLGLTFAGLTGFCGLARVMAKMPWNAID